MTIRSWPRQRDGPRHGFERGRRRGLSELIKRSFSLAGHRTSVALEAAFWDVLEAIAQYRGMSLGRLVASVDAGRDSTTALASSLRLLALHEALNGSWPGRHQKNGG